MFIPIRISVFPKKESPFMSEYVLSLFQSDVLLSVQSMSVKIKDYSLKV
jgi:hypothetical protein